jgi:thiol-disulfide isomerase/thioredoxin
VTIANDPKATHPTELAGVIRSLGYEVDEVPVEAAAREHSETLVAPLPDDAPASFAASFRSARADGRPILIDFWAKWCAPCIQLKEKTLADPKVVKALEDVEVIFVNLDEHPGLAKAYGVASVPDVFFVDEEGRVTDRLRSFEEPEPFLGRLARWLDGTKAASLGLSTSAPSDEAVRDMGLANNVRVLGRLIDAVAPDGPAAAAGLAAGDVLLRIEDNDLYSADDIADYLAVSAPGDRATVRFKRKGDAEPRETTVVLGRGSSSRSTGGLHWQFAGLGQLPKALEVARAQKKKVMVGLSGAET